MEVSEVNPDYYNTIISKPYTIFNSPGFNLLNSEKCDSLHFFLIKNNKYRLGIIGGASERTFKSPFSAPFGGFSYLDEKISFKIIDEAIDAFEEHLHSRGIEQINITYPPLFYSEGFISKLINSHYRKNYIVDNIDVDFYIDNSMTSENYLQKLWYNARKNYKSSLKQNLEIIVCKDLVSKRAAYDVIKHNRIVKGYPLRMTFDQIIETTKIVKADFFLLSYKLSNVAAALVFWAAEDVVQVIYWGDDPNFAELKSMNYLSFYLFEYYKNAGVKIIDIGPSTENSVPNFGLCDFKESIGCGLNLKFSFIKILK